MAMAVKLLASKITQHFSSYPAAFGFQASTPLDNIGLNVPNKKANESVLDF